MIKSNGTTAGLIAVVALESGSVRILENSQKIGREQASLTRTSGVILWHHDLKALLRPIARTLMQYEGWVSRIGYHVFKGRASGWIESRRNPRECEAPSGVDAGVTS